MSQPANTKPDYFEGLDGLQEDMAAHQRRFSGEVTAEANRKLAAEAIERLEKEQADAKSIAVDVPPPDMTAKKIDTKTIEDRTYTITREADNPSEGREANDHERWFLAHMVPRIQLLLAKWDRGPLNSPSWAERVLAACRWRQVNPRRYLMELFQVLDDSNRLFGDWKADPEPKIFVGGGR